MTGSIPLHERVFIALDVPSIDDARHVVDAIGDVGQAYKIGHHLQFCGGLELARDLIASGRKVFLDAKLHDIPNTVTHGVQQLAGMGLSFLTVHAYPQTMAAAVAGTGTSGLTVLGVTVLTSMSDADLVEAGYAGTAREVVETRARQALDAGIGGLVCAPAEVARLRQIVGDRMRLVTPGIRPAGADAGDQKRVATPANAIAEGADHLVIGRPIAKATDPRAATLAILAEIDGALAHA